MQPPVSPMAIGYEWQGRRSPFKGLPHFPWFQIDHAIAETKVGAGLAVVDFIWMKNDYMSGQAVAPSAAIVEGLHARQRQADGVRVMPMRRVSKLV